MQLYDSIFKRQSIRKYQPESLPMEQLAQITEYMKGLKPLYADISTRIELAGPADVKGIVSAKAPHYLLFYSQKKDGYLPNAGFLLEQADLYLSSIGLGSCWQGMAKTTAPARDGLDYVIALAFGKAQGDPHRKAVSEFKRKSLSEISTGTDARLEAARLAPSATNSQPWYFTCQDGRICVYRKKLGPVKALMYETMNQIDMGIALCHLWLTSEQQNRAFDFTDDPQGAPAMAGYHFIGIVG